MKKLFSCFNVSILILAAGLTLAGPAQAINLLNNPGFETPPSGHVPYATPPYATDWIYYSPPVSANYFGDYWVQSVSTDHQLASHSGTFYWNEWGATYSAAPTNNVAGIYQSFSSAPGSTYQASGWLASASHDDGGLGPDNFAWIQVEFLDARTNVLALYKSGSFSASAGLDTWFLYSVTNACDLTQPVATGDPYFTTYAETGSVSQLVAPLGTVAVRYRYALLQADAEGGSCDLDDAVLNQISGPVPPVIGSLFPQNMIFVSPGSGLSFNVTSPSGFTINNSGIHVMLNGTNVSGSLVISGSASSKNVLYSQLQSNSTYTVSITVTDAYNLTASASTYFETTWVGVQPVTYLWEAEDWDFNSGMYIDNPDLSSVAGDPNSYFGTVGVEGVDEHNTSGKSGPFRPEDPMGQAPAGDYNRPNFYAAEAQDYRIDPFNFGEWVNYTRDWPNSTNWVIARVSAGVGSSGSMTLSVVNPDASTTALGLFSLAGGSGYSTFENVYLKDTNGNNVNLVLNGKETLQVASFPGGNLLPNFFMLVAAQVDLPILSNLYPDGLFPFEATNALSFTVTAPGTTFPTNGIRMSLDGIDVSANLLITGSGSTKNVVYPGLQLNAAHTAIITVTNSLGHGTAVTDQFDTFTQTNFMVEAEDFDYGGGQYISAANWYPDAYQGLDGVAGIDFNHSPIDGEQFPYRFGIPQSQVQNYAVEARQEFINAGAIDFQLDNFGIGDWANYSDTYPAGNFNLYVRSAGLFNTPFTMELDQVISGVGTTNQVTSHLGQWSAVGINQQTYTWVPLTDSGLVAPVVVNLGGVSTLRITTPTGFCYPNYFMLVPVSGISLTAQPTVGHVKLGFPTASNATYRVFYRPSLISGDWILLGKVLGNGTVATFSDPVTTGQRFYQVTSP